MASALVRYLTIVPAAHVRLFDFGYQARLYDAFHRRELSIIGHAVCTPIVLGFMFAAAAHAPGVEWVLAAALFAYYLYCDRLVGLVLAPPLALLAYLGSWFAEAWGPGSLGVAIGGMFAAAALQTISHALEPVPPPLSERSGFVPVGEWLRTVSRPKLALAMVLMVTAFTLLELFASPRVFACQAQRFLFRLGHTPERRSRMRAEADRMHLRFADGEVP
jgi:hypothetical protein